MVVGASPAGYTAAFYLAHFPRKVAILHAGTPRARYVPKIHHLIGHEKNLSGPKLLTRLRAHAVQLQIPILKGRGVVHREGRGFRIDYGNSSITAQRVILATGITDHEPTFAETLELKRKGYLRYCPICDGHDFRDHPLAVLVQGTSGIHEAEFIAKYTPNLHVIVLKNFKLLQNHRDIIDSCKIKVHRKKVKQIAISKHPVGMNFYFEGGEKLFVRAAYVALGKRVNDEAYAHLKVRKTKEGFLRLNANHETSIKGVYAIGDCANDLYQISVAAAHGAIAATDVHNSLFG